MKFSVNTFPALVTLSFLTASTICAAYETKSKFKADYKCISDVQGGYNHTQSGHKFVEFKQPEEYFLTHISNVPITAVNKYLTENRNMSVENYSIDQSRKNFENSLLKVNDYSSGDSIYISETGSYFIREPSQDPNAVWIYTMHGSCDTTFYKFDDGEKRSMSCFSDNRVNSFQFNIDTGKFTFTYTGSWHEEQKDPNYFGDSAVIAMGMCRPYFR